MKNTIVQNFLADDEAIIITGSLNCNMDDRYLNREAIHPVQLFMDGELRPISYFDSWGDFGASSFTWLQTDTDKFFFTTGDSIYLFDVTQGIWQSLSNLPLKDVHEMELIDNVQWISNTGHDEVIGIDPLTGRISQRVALKMMQRKSHVEKLAATAEEIKTVDKFHCNQVTQSYDGQLLALVHHTSGQQIIRKVANKIIKNQGNGGVINLDTGESIDLKLKSPHNIRKINGNYWIFDSGNSRIHIYDKQWQLIKKINSAGFARGADITQSGVLCVGISETRKRYLDIIKGAKKVPNMLQFYSTKDHKLLAEIIIRDIEQINNVYVVKRKKAEQLLQLGYDSQEYFPVGDYVDSMPASI